MSAPERIWIEHGDECPYFYEEDELHEVGSAVIEYVRADIAEREAAELRTEVEIQRASKEYAQQCCDHTEARAEDLSRQLAERDAELARDERSKLRLAFRKALTALPEIAPPEISAILSSVQMRDEFLNEGKRLQEKHGTVAVAPRVEQECGAGAWSFMREGVRAALSGSGYGWQTAGCFEVGTPVQKVTGYPFPGEVRAVFMTRGKQIRYVIEATGADYAGMLHIFSPTQLEAAPASPSPNR